VLSLSRLVHAGTSLRSALSWVERVRALTCCLLARARARVGVVHIPYTSLQCQEVSNIVCAGECWVYLVVHTQAV
jgi:hypothetical protein